MNRQQSKLLYHRLMLPDWLRKNAEWNSPKEGNELNLDILPDSSDWENILRVPLIPSGELSNEEDITVKMKCNMNTYPTWHLQSLENMNSLWKF
ncbi:hypothetical protein pdam_00022473 [Pocillopora damicornis]|uniref:Uncharacterized protein n=1 Tax=Pocillopora damicornis TaxID=46731 RepID=A0A3M6UI20_POCDA|nr:hypothetical protein pdam_00022473 [Pocillopora damicornis]